MVLALRTTDVVCRAAKIESAPLAFQAGRGVGFQHLSADTAGIRFTNQLSEESAAANRVLEIGSGVAAGDIDGDGLPDLFFCSLSGDCRLYRNLGGLRFEDVTSDSGVDCRGLVCRGAALIDVDGDGRLDLLISVMGRGILCFRNAGGGKFEDRTRAAGTGNPFAATSMAFADVDGNGTIDFYVTNYRTNDVRDTGRVDLQSVNGRTVVPPALRSRFLLVDGKLQEYGEPDLLYLNDGHGHFSPAPWIGGRFRDNQGKVLTAAPLDWGLGAAFHDLNGDGYPDLYVCNDYWTPDRVWLNDGKGVFTAVLAQALRHTSASSMGVDFADIDGDGHEDFFVVDMLASGRADRLCQSPAFTGPEAVVGEIFDRPQLNRNTLFHNRGDSTWEEIGEFSGLEGTDWSWQPLFLDVDLDGFSDLLIAGGHGHSVQDMDANAAVEVRRPRWPLNQASVEIDGKVLPFQKAFSINRMKELRSYPSFSSPLRAFRNKGNLQFEEKTDSWGLAEKAIRQGVALADLDNDGDLDVIVNPLNSPAELWINHAGAPRVAFELVGRAPNTDAIGAKLTLFGGPTVRQGMEVAGAGHYLSCSQRRLVFAASGNQMRLEVAWRSGERAIFEGIRANRVYRISE